MYASGELFYAHNRIILVRKQFVTIYSCVRVHIPEA